MEVWSRPRSPAMRYILIGILAAASQGLPAARAAEDGEELPPEAAPLAPVEQAYLDEFLQALTRFRGLSPPDFEAEFGPRKAYLRQGGGLFLRSDANASGGVDLSDGICILQHLFDGASACARVACVDALDVDDSGEIDLSDAIALLMYLFLDGLPPRAPHPSPGTDPTPDPLGCGGAESILSYEPVLAEGLSLVFAHFLPSPGQEDAYRRNGFVIYDNVKFESMLGAYFELWRRHLPVYITVDSILDALHLSFDRILMELEEGGLTVELQAMLDAMEAGIGGLEEIAGGRDISAELDDVAVWTCTARSLLLGEKVPCARGVDGTVGEVLGLIAAEMQASPFLLGAWRNIDFSQYRVRGHYTRSEALSRYFRAMMWVQRIGLELTRRARDARVAHLLTALLERTGAIASWRRIDETVKALIDDSDSLNPPGLSTFMARGGYALGDLYAETRFGEFRAAALASGLGRQRINSEWIRINPFEEFVTFPSLFHVMGQRFTVDSHVFQNVTFDRVKVPGGFGAQRWMPSPLDAWFALGNRSTVPLLRGELERWGYQANLAALQGMVEAYSVETWSRRMENLGDAPEWPGTEIYLEDFWGSSLYNVWLDALRTLHADTTSDRYPEVMRTETWDRHMLHTQLASWAHLRRDFILYAKPSMPPGGCFYPDGWVDPYPEFYETIGRFADRARGTFLGLAESAGEAWTFQNTASDLIRYFDELAYVATELSGIARTELSEEELSEGQIRFIRSWLTQRTLGCGVGPEEEIDRTEPMVFDGWYPRIIYLDRGSQPGGGAATQSEFNPGEGFDPTIADVHTTPPDQGSRVLEVAVGHPRLILISVNDDCGTRAYAGPSLSYHEFVSENLHRWTDEEWKVELESGANPPRPWWTREFRR